MYFFLFSLLDYPYWREVSNKGYIIKICKFLISLKERQVVINRLSFHLFPATLGNTPQAGEKEEKWTGVGQA